MEENQEGSSHREISRVREARLALAMFGYPSYKIFEQMVITINDLPITIEEICNANTIYGCDVTTLKGKRVHQQSKRVQAEYKEVTYRLK